MQPVVGRRIAFAAGNSGEKLKVGRKLIVSGVDFQAGMTFDGRRQSYIAPGAVGIMGIESPQSFFCRCICALEFASRKASIPPP